MRIEAACGCSVGKFRNRNSDNFLFDGRSLPIENNGIKHAVSVEMDITRPACWGVFDGMDAEASGAIASYTAAQTLKNKAKDLEQYIVPEKQFLKSACFEMNQAVYSASQNHNGKILRATAVLALFSSEQIYICNLGDSRAYRLRSGEFMQLTHDHIERRTFTEQEMRRRKTEMQQYLGAAPSDRNPDPYIAKGELKINDWYLLCSNGLTDMLTNFEISNLLHNARNTSDCVNSLIKMALERGGLDNIAVIVCRIVQ